MNRKHSKLFLVVLAASHLYTAAGAGPLFPTDIVISAEHLGWGSRSTNLTLALSNGVYAAGNYTVAPALVSNLLAFARRPWPKPNTNTWSNFVSAGRDWVT